MYYSVAGSLSLCSKSIPPCYRLLNKEYKDTPEQLELQHLGVCPHNNNNDDNNNKKMIKHEKYNVIFHLVICQ